MQKKRERFTDQSRFWVIFDTCQLTSYYQDLHNLLALPSKSIIRYDYRALYISDPALDTIKANTPAPARALLVYMQHGGYTRGAGLDYRPLENEKTFVVATRFGQMRVIPNIGGDRYAFDLELGGYPRMHAEMLTRILQPLVDANQVPWSKWVTISDLVGDIAQLKLGTEADNWSAIVDTLGESPSQFAGDVFWRLAPPLRDSKRTMDPTFENKGTPESGGIRQVSFSYKLPEGHSCEFEVFSHSGHGAKRELRVSVPENGSLEYNGAPVIDLRYDAATRIAVRGQRAETVDDRFGLLTLDSGDPVNNWPIGPRLTLQFKIVKSKWAVAIAVILLLIAVVLGACAEKLWKDSISWAIPAAVIAAGCILVGLAVLTRKITVKL
jgi:hypothetical protein